MVKQAVARMMTWNRDNPESRIRITTQQIAQRVREANLSREQRFIKSAPKEIRGQVVKDLHE